VGIRLEHAWCSGARASAGGVEWRNVPLLSASRGERDKAPASRGGTVKAGSVSRGFPGLSIVAGGDGIGGVCGRLGRDAGFDVTGAAMKHRGTESVHRGRNLGGGPLVVTAGKESGLVKHADGDSSVRARARQCCK